jgi:hypothetical protein
LIAASTISKRLHIFGPIDRARTSPISRPLAVLPKSVIL